MSKNDDKVSEREHDEQESDSVFDFLYHDARRVGSFLAQFDDAGHLQQITQSESAGIGGKRSLKFTAGGGLPGLGSAQFGVERGPLEEGSETSERVYDPLWANARALLDYLQEKNLIVRDISSARIGQFVLVSGTLEIMDLSMLKLLWEDTNMKKLMAQGTEAASRNIQNRTSRKGKNTSPSELEIGLTFLKMLPHSIQARIYGEANVWCNLLRNGLVGSVDDLLLKHGGQVQGHWQTLGILDAFVDERNSDNNDDEHNLDIQQDVSMASTLLKQIAPFARQFLGRPSNAYGLTPIVIFREVVGLGIQKRLNP